ncbi:hypothetical protein BpHYR1_014403 [Brachionus plicatilis]|uniref:Uncharacterized protein n=1 Tax=Brachionus plicatilis TaxID=10195 RepID=A0A3M7QCL7_BRAPC|nr:hypothetical protein BpHYR1_014403 [Brachionus plicatilis]
MGGLINGPKSSPLKNMGQSQSVKTVRSKLILGIHHGTTYIITSAFADEVSLLSTLKKLYDKAQEGLHFFEP